MLKEIYRYGLSLLAAEKARAVLRANFGANAELDYLTGKGKDYQQRLDEVLQARRNFRCCGEFVASVRLAGVYLRYLDYCKQVADEDFVEGVASEAVSFGEFLEWNNISRAKAAA